MKFSGRLSCGHLGVIRAEVQGNCRPSKPWKKKNEPLGADMHDPNVRMSMTPGPFKKTSVRENLWADFRSVLQFFRSTWMQDLDLLKIGLGFGTLIGRVYRPPLGSLDRFWFPRVIFVMWLCLASTTNEAWKREIREGLNAKGPNAIIIAKERRLRCPNR